MSDGANGSGADEDDYEEFEIEYTKYTKVVTEKPASGKETTIELLASSGDDEATTKTESSSSNNNNNNKTVAARRKSSVAEQQQQQQQPPAPQQPPTGIFMLYGKDLSEYDSIPVDDILAKLSPQELEQLNDEVDPDDNLLPPSQRCKEHSSKEPTGPVNRKQLIHYLASYALQQEDWPEPGERHQPGTKRGKIFVPRRGSATSAGQADIPIMLDLDEVSSSVLNSATESDLVDLAGILGLHSMLNQDQYYSSIAANKSQRRSSGDNDENNNNNKKFESIVKSTPIKPSKAEPENTTDPMQVLELLSKNEPSLEEVNLNNLKHITRGTFERIFEALKTNTNLKSLSLSNVGLTDGSASKLVEALRENKTLKTINLESNFLSGLMIRNLIEALLDQQRVLEFRACNQRPQILGNRIEMEITKLVEKNPTLLRLGLNFDVPDARMRVAKHLQDNHDSNRLVRIGKKALDFCMKTFLGRGNHRQVPQQPTADPIYVQ